MNKNKIFAVLLFIGDIGIFYLSLYLAFLFRKFSVPDFQNFISLALPSLPLFLLWALLLFIFGFYEKPFVKKRMEIGRRTISFALFALLVGTAYFYLQPRLQLTPRAILILTTLSAAVLLVFWRYVFILLYGKRKFKERVIIVGSCPELGEIIEKERNDLTYEIIAIFHKDPQTLSGIKTIKSFKELKKESLKADTAVLTPEIRKDKEFIKKIFKALPLKINYMEFSGFYEKLTGKVPLYSVDELWFLENISSRQRKLDEIIKRIAELFFSVLALLITVVIFPFIALAIKATSRGPVLYRQKRVGAEGKEFTLYKFRTMRHNTEKGEFLWREKEKGEVTVPGKFLRSTHLDELPQFYNLLKGEVGIIGPRPEWVRTARVFEKEIPFYHLRYLVRPGITGWAQLHYPASTCVKEAKEKFEYDLYYIKNRNFFLDFIILLKTLRIIF